MKSISDYQNYREFLSDFYQHKKQHDKKFTYARFSKAAGIKSPNYLKLVTTGEKNLTPDNIIRFTKALELKTAEADIFEALVHFNQAKEALQKEYYQSRLQRVRNRVHNKVDGKTLKEYEFEMMSSWLHHTLMVFTNVKGFLPSAPWIKKKLFDLVSEDEITRALDQLLALGMLKKNANGRVEQTFKQVQTEPVLRRLSAKLFYEGLLKRSVESLHLGEPAQREFGTLLVGLSEDQVQQVKKRVREFIKELNDLALENPEPDQVYSITVATFPMTDNKEVLSC